MGGSGRAAFGDPSTDRFGGRREGGLGVLTGEDEVVGVGPALPDRTHLGDRRERRALLTGETEALHDRIVGDLLERREHGRRAAARGEQFELQLLGVEVVEQERLGQVLGLGERRDHEALHAHEHLGCAAVDRRDRLDGEVDAGVGEAAGRPRAGDRERCVPGGERLVHDVVADVLGDEAGVAPFSELVRRVERALAVEAEVVGDVRAVVGLTEDVAAGPRVERVVVERVARILLHGERHVDGAVGLEREGGLGERLERGRGLGHEVDVADEGDVLGGVRQAVGGAVERERLDGDVAVEVGVGAEVDRQDHAVGHELAEPVVGADDDVGAFTGRTCDGEVVADLVERDLEHRHVDALVGREGLGDRGQDRGAGVVGPDDQVGVATCGRNVLLLFLLGGSLLVCGGFGVGGCLGVGGLFLRRCLGLGRGLGRRRLLGVLGRCLGLGRLVGLVSRGIVVAAARSGDECQGGERRDGTDCLHRFPLRKGRRYGTAAVVVVANVQQLAASCKNLADR